MREALFFKWPKAQNLLVFRASKSSFGWFSEVEVEMLALPRETENETENHATEN